MTLLPRLRGPGLGWLPLALRQRDYWAVVWRFALVGPLIGGLPYVWTVVTIPFAYALGLAPAAIAGALYAAWWVAPSTRAPSALWRAAVGAICGACGCALTALAISPASPNSTLLLLGLHGVPASTVLALAWWRPSPAGSAARPSHSADLNAFERIPGAPGAAV